VSTVPRQLSDVVPAHDVAVTIGGNDAGFSEVVFACTHAFISPAPCADALADAQARIERLKQRLTDTYLAVADAYPRARIFVMGYPNIMSVQPPVIGPPQLAACQFIPAAAVELMVDETKLLDQTIASAVAATRNVRIRYVDDLLAFSGHELCTAVEWVNPVDLAAALLPDRGYGNVGAFHPNAVGQIALASCLADAIGGRAKCRRPPPASACDCFFSASSSTLGGPPIAVSISRLRPGSHVTLTWHSSPQVLARTVVDRTGRVALLVRPPASSIPGHHLLVVLGRRANGRRFKLKKAITIARPAVGATPPRKAPQSSRSLWKALIIGGAVLLAMLTVIAGRHHRRR
jgi:hypothetical protein